MMVTSANGSCIEAAREDYFHGSAGIRAVAPRSGVVGTASAIADLAVFIVAPAVKRGIVHDGARVALARADISGAKPAGQARFHGRVAVIGGPVPQLPVEVIPPTVQRVIGEDGASMGTSIAHREFPGRVGLRGIATTKAKFEDV